METREIITIICLSLGTFFVAASLIGVLRLKDFFCHLQAAGIGSGLGVIFYCVGLAVYEGWNLTSLKILFVGVMLLVTCPIGTHIIGKVAYTQGKLVRYVTIGGNESWPEKTADSSSKLEKPYNEK